MSRKSKRKAHIGARASRVQWFAGALDDLMISLNASASERRYHEKWTDRQHIGWPDPCYTFTESCWISRMNCLDMGRGRASESALLLDLV